jgi:CheY-like chemotaxis protein
VTEAQDSRKTILTIEDEPEIADLLGFLLEASQLAVTKCDNGVEGLELVRRLKPDLVIMDVMLPQMGGWQVYDEVRKDEQLKHIPIIMLSVAYQDFERRRAFRGSSIDFYMTKPFDALSLRRKVQEILGFEIWPQPAPKPK